MKKYFLSLSIFIVLSSLFVGCGYSQTAYSGSGFYFDTFITVTYYGPHAKEAVEASLELAKHYDDLWDKNKESSDIYRLNQEAGKHGLEIDDDTEEMLEAALFVSTFSNGATTPLIGSVSSLWDFKSASPSLPDPDEINAALKYTHISYMSDYFTPQEKKMRYIVCNENAKLDVGFIAKGFAADKMKKSAKEMGVKSGWINLGGNVLVIGEKPDGEAFKIGIKDPQNVDESILTLEIRDESVVTSGCYERCFELDNVNYFHILDPKTGYPVRNNLLSVTVIGPESGYCDALSTTLFVLGYEEGSSFLSNYYPAYRAVFITDEREILKTY